MSRPPFNGLAETERMNAIRAKNKSGKASRKVTGIAPIAEKMAATKAEMAKGFHPECAERDRVCADCQNFYGRTRKAGKHADHIIPQAQCSKEERLNPKFGTGCCAECNALRNQKLHQAAILEDGDLFYQIRWHRDTGTCVRRLMSDPPGAWFAWDKPERMKDGNRY